MNAMKRGFAIAALGVLLASSSFAQHGPWEDYSSHQMTGSELSGFCTSKGQGDGIACRFYVLGMVQGIIAAATQVPTASWFHDVDAAAAGKLHRPPYLGYIFPHPRYHSSSVPDDPARPDFCAPDRVKLESIDQQQLASAIIERVAAIVVLYPEYGPLPAINVVRRSISILYPCKP